MIPIGIVVVLVGTCLMFVGMIVILVGLFVILVGCLLIRMGICWSLVGILLVLVGVVDSCWISYGFDGSMFDSGWNSVDFNVML